MVRISAQSPIMLDVCKSEPDFLQFLFDTLFVFPLLPFPHIMIIELISQLTASVYRALLWITINVFAQINLTLSTLTDILSLSHTFQWIW